jgi:hypothetical protein
MFTYLPIQSLAQTGANTSALNVRAIPDDGSSLQTIENTSSYLGVYYNTGPDLRAVLGPASADQLRMDERDGRVQVPLPVRKPALTGPEPSLALPALTERTQHAWTAAHREFVSARPGRGGGSGGMAPAPVSPPLPAYEPPQYKPEMLPPDTVKKSSTPPDSLKKHGKHPAKPKPPKPPKPPGDGEGAG